MDTVVEENPLSFATSRMVTIAGALQRTREPRSDIVVSERSLPLELKRALADTTAETSCECQEHESRRLFTFCFYW
jgi:hypothetical protein